MENGQTPEGQIEAIIRPSGSCQLEEDGVLLPGKNTLTTQRRIRGGRVRIWQLKSDFLGCDSNAMNRKNYV